MNTKLTQKQYIGAIEYTLNQNTKKVYTKFIPAVKSFEPFQIEGDLEKNNMIQKNQTSLTNWLLEVTSIEDKIDLFNENNIVFEQIVNKKALKKFNIYLITDKKP